MANQRLKLNRSRPPLLKTDDLLIAYAIPVSQAVHQFAFAISNSGSFEFTDQITKSGASQHVTGTVDQKKIFELRSLIDSLAIASSWMKKISFDSIDPNSYETDDRRLLRFWSNETAAECRWMNPEYCIGSLNVSKDSVKSFALFFDRLWLELLSVSSSAQLTVGSSKRFPLHTKLN